MTALQFHDVVVAVVVVQSTKVARQKAKGHELLKQTTTSPNRTTRPFMQDLKLAINAIDSIRFNRRWRPKQKLPASIIQCAI
jgi:hypothetical protein